RDAADRLNFVRNELGLAKTEARFPRKDTCLAIYSHTVNARCALAETLENAFSLVCGMGSRTEEPLPYLRRSKAAGERARLRRPAPLLGGYDGGAGAGAARR